MKLNQELLLKIQEDIGHENIVPYWKDSKHGFWRVLDTFTKEKLWPEVCRRYSEQIIKCDGCDGSGEREFYHETLGDSPCSCSLCEGKGYLEEYPTESTFVNGREFLEHSLSNGRQYLGLTKRELFSMAALQGILTHTSSPDDGTVKMAISLADELLKQLDNEKA